MCSLFIFFIYPVICDPSPSGGRRKEKASRAAVRLSLGETTGLVAELRAAFQEEGFLLTAAIGAAKGTIDVSYDVPNMYKYLDFVNGRRYICENDN